MIDNFKYTGEVTVDFLDKDKNIKSTVKAKNSGTPAFFLSLCNIMTRGINLSSDERPGKIMLFNPNNSSTPLLTSPGIKNDAEVVEENNVNFAEYTFLISSYQLNSTTLSSSVIENLSGYQFALLKDNFNGFDSSENIITDPSTLAVVSIPSTSENSNYSLSEGEYLNVLWRLSFDNQTQQSNT